MTEPAITVEHNWYTVLGLPLGAPVAQVRTAYERLSAEARERGDAALLSQLDEAHFGLSHEGMRAFHNQKIKWAAAGEWYRRKYPNGRGADEHRLWAEYRREVIEAETARRRWWRGAAAS